ncbi:unnamed protein product [Lactuca saligna]|uniref:Uncharacterized protein n=1 Tax=Lactuca saligna TaxID=75948 RepID=A0AA35ZL83_LACSI|nr:unnamed protein product [Lactuca saligna]
MWDVEGLWEKPMRYKGHRQHKYVIRSCFGGVNSTFISSGSEIHRYISGIEVVVIAATSSKGAGPSMLEGQSGYGSTMQDSPEFTSGDYHATTQNCSCELSNDFSPANKLLSSGRVILDLFTRTNALSKLASTSHDHLTKKVLVKVLPERSIDNQTVNTISTPPEWTKPFVDYLHHGMLPDDPLEARKV